MIKKLCRLNYWSTVYFVFGFIYIFIIINFLNIINKIRLFYHIILFVKKNMIIRLFLFNVKLKIFILYKLRSFITVEN